MIKNNFKIISKLFVVLAVVAFVYSCGSGPGGDEGGYNSVILSAIAPTQYQSHAVETKEDNDSCVSTGIEPDALKIKITSSALTDNPSPVKLYKYDIEFIPRGITNTLVSYNNTKTISALISPGDSDVEVTIIPLNEYEKSNIGLPAASEEYDLKITFHGNEINYNEDETFVARTLYTYMVPSCD